MPFCPNCHYEYREGITVCPDCHEALVASLPLDAEDESASDDLADKNWIQIARFPSSEYAEMVLEALRAKDIPAVVLSGTGHFGLTGQMGVSSFRVVGGGYSLMVPEERVVAADREARLILGEEWENSKLIDIDSQ